MSQLLRSLWNRWKPRRSTVAPVYRPQLEGLETRTLPSITLPTAGSFGSVVLVGSSGHDQFVLRLQAGNSNNLQISDNGGASFSTVSVFAVGGVTITGDAGQDTLTIDNSNGVAGKAGGLPITFTGGIGHNTILLTGNPGSLISETYLVGPTVDAGTFSVIAMTAGAFTLNFTSVAAITDTMSVNILKVVFPNNPNYVALNPGPAIGNLATLKIGGIDFQNNEAVVNDIFGPPPAPKAQVAAGLSFVPITVANKDTILLTGGTANNLFLLNDAFAVTGLADLEIDGNSNISQFVPVGLTANFIPVYQQVESSNTSLIVGDGFPAGAAFNVVNLQQALSSGTSSGANDAVFVIQLYAQLLKRIPNASEVAYWIAVEHQSGQQAVVDGIEQSWEARADLVWQWYAYYLNSPANLNSLIYYVNQLQQGLSEEQVLANILGTSQYASLANNAITTGTANQRFVTALYQQLLEANPTSAQMASALQVITAQGRTQLALNLLTSTAVETRFVSAAYTAYFGTTPSNATIKTYLTNNFTFTLVREELLSNLIFLNAPKANATKVAFAPSLTAQEQGQSSGTTNPRYYSIVVGVDRTLNVNVQATSGVAPLVVLEDAVGNVLAETQPGSNVNQLQAKIAPGQTYYLRVVSSDGNPVSYTLNLAL